MSDRDRLAADLRKTHDDYWDDPHLPPWSEFYADRLIALGWTRLDEERLARALRASSAFFAVTADDLAAAIAKAYREDTDDH